MGMNEIRPIDHGGIQQSGSKSARPSSVSFKDLLRAQLEKMSSAGAGDPAAAVAPDSELKVVNYELSGLVNSIRNGEVGFKDIDRSFDDLLRRLVGLYSRLV